MSPLDSTELLPALTEVTMAIMRSIPIRLDHLEVHLKARASKSKNWSEIPISSWYKRFQKFQNSFIERSIAKD